MKPRSKILVYISLLILIDTIPLPLPVTALVLLYVVLQRPTWFSDMVRQVYQ